MKVLVIAPFASRMVDEIPTDGEVLRAFNPVDAAEMIARYGPFGAVICEAAFAENETSQLFRLARQSGGRSVLASGDSAEEDDDLAARNGADAVLRLPKRPRTRRLTRAV